MPSPSKALSVQAGGTTVTERRAGYRRPPAAIEGAAVSAPTTTAAAASAARIRHMAQEGEIITGVRGPGSRIRGPGSGVRGRGSGVRDPERAVRCDRVELATFRQRATFSPRSLRTLPDGPRTPDAGSRIPAYRYPSNTLGSTSVTHGSAAITASP